MLNISFINDLFSLELRKLRNTVSIMVLVATGHYSHIFEHLEWEDWTVGGLECGLISLD